MVDLVALVELATSGPTKGHNTVSRKLVRVAIRTVEGRPVALNLVYDRGRARSAANTSS